MSCAVFQPLKVLSYMIIIVYDTSFLLKIWENMYSTTLKKVIVYYELWEMFIYHEFGAITTNIKHDTTYKCSFTVSAEIFIYNNSLWNTNHKTIQNFNGK